MDSLQAVEFRRIICTQVRVIFRRKRDGENGNESQPFPRYNFLFYFIYL